MSRARAAARGMFAVMVGELLARGASVASLLIVARLLGPTELGRAAIALLALTAIESLVSLGLGAAVQASDDPGAAASGAGGLAVVIGLLGASAALAGAPLLAAALGDPSAEPLLRAVAPVVLLARWNEVRAATIERELRFARTSVINVASSFTAASVSIAAAAAGAGAWSIVLQPIVRESLTTIGLALAPYGQTLRPRFNRREMAHIWSLSKHLLANTLVVFMYTNLDDAAVSRFLGTTSLGLYGFAYRVSNFPTYFFTRTLNRVLLPLWMQLRSNRQAWRSAYCATLRLLAWMTGSMMCAIALLGPYALNTFYGLQWTEAKMPLAILSIYGLFRAVGATTGAVFLASGQPKLLRQIAQTQLLFMTLLLVPALSRHSIALVAVAVTLPLVVGVVYALVRAGQVVGLSSRHIVKEIGEPWAAAALANLLGLASASLFRSHPLHGLALGLLVSATACTGYGLLRLRPHLWHIVSAIRSKKGLPSHLPQPPIDG